MNGKWFDFTLLAEIRWKWLHWRHWALSSMSSGPLRIFIEKRCGMSRGVRMEWLSNLELPMWPLQEFCIDTDMDSFCSQDILTTDLLVSLHVLALFSTWNTIPEQRRIPTKHAKLMNEHFLSTKIFHQKIPTKRETQWVWIWPWIPLRTNLGFNLLELEREFIYKMTQSITLHCRIINHNGLLFFFCLPLF